jgi:2-dehydro-3-deoxy-L-rhamnonate dehydrogenase (NAD+)
VTQFARMHYYLRFDARERHDYDITPAFRRFIHCAESVCMLNIDLAGQVAVVTGARGGIGHAIAQALRAAGARVALWDLAAGGTEESADTASFGVDVTREASVTAAMTATLAHFQRIDILVNGAGLVGNEVLMEELSLEEWRRIVEANLTSVFLCSRSAIPVMRKQSYGRIVNIASNAGKDCNPYQSAYSAAKAAVIGLTKSLGRELAETGILVNCVTPALIDTPLATTLTDHTRATALSKIPMKRMGRPDEVAALVAWLASDQCSFSTGAAYDLSGGRASY